MDESFRSFLRNACHKAVMHPALHAVLCAGMDPSAAPLIQIKNLCAAVAPYPGRHERETLWGIVLIRAAIKKSFANCTPSFDFAKNQTCHLDPGTYDRLGNRLAEWKHAFGSQKTGRSRTRLPLGRLMRITALYSARSWAGRKTPSMCTAPFIMSVIKRTYPL